MFDTVIMVIPIVPILIEVASLSEPATTYKSSKLKTDKKEKENNLL